MIAEVDPAGEEYQPHKLELELYRLYRPGYLPNFDQLDLVSREERQRFWKNVELLFTKLQNLKKSGIQKALSGQEINQVVIINNLIGEIIPIESQFAPLNEHLAKVSNYARKLVKILLEQAKSSSESESPLNKKGLTVIAEIVAPLHDIIKHLSKPSGQFSTDHQVVIQHVLSHYGHILGLDSEESTLAAEVAGDHENASTISRAELLETAKNKNLEQKEIALIHAKVIFYFIDTFTEVIVEEEPNAELKVNPEALKGRFRDILDRWNDPLLTPGIEPEWALLAYKDYSAAINLLEKTYGLKIAAEARLAVIESAVMSFRELLELFKYRQKDEHKLKVYGSEKFKPLPTAKIDQFETVILELERLAQVEREEQKQATLSILVTRLENLFKSLAVGERSEGLRLTRVLQSTYEVVSAAEIIPEAKEISAADYKQVEPKFQAFNITAITSVINLIYYYLNSPLNQTQMLDFFDKQSSKNELSVAEIMEQPTFQNLAKELAMQLHNQYAITLGNRQMWSTLGEKEEDREKKEKSYIVAVQLLVGAVNYLSKAKLNETLVLSLQDRNLLRRTNFPRENDSAQFMRQAMMRNFNLSEGSSGEIIAARAAHEFWFAAKKATGTKDLAMETSAISANQVPVRHTEKNGKTFDPALKHFNQLHPTLVQKNLDTIKIAVENIISILSEEKYIDDPLPKLAQLIDYLYQIISGDNNSLIIAKLIKKDKELAAFAELLTSMQYKSWLMNKLAKENGFQELVNADGADYFSIWQTKDENRPYAKLGQLEISFKDLDRIPLLTTAITLYINYYDFLTAKHSKLMNFDKHLEDLKMVEEIAQKINF